MPTSIVPLQRAPQAALSRRTNTPEDVLRAFFARRSPDTVRGYRLDLESFVCWLQKVEPATAPANVTDLTRFLFALGPGNANALLMQWVHELSARLAPRTINRRLAAVKSLVKLGRTLGLITWALDVSGIKNPRNVRDMRGPSVGGVQKLLNTAREKPMLNAMLHLLFTRGLRSIEVRELKMKHLKLDAATIFVRGKGKTGLEPLTIGDGTVQALRSWLRVRKGNALADDYVFTLRQGNPLSHTTIWDQVTRHGAAVGVPVRPHGLRHTAITEVLNKTNGDIRTGQRFSRHAKADMLLNYDDERRDLGGEVSKKLDELVREQ